MGRGLLRTGADHLRRPRRRAAARRRAAGGASALPVALEAIRPGDLLFFRGETGDRITHVAFAGEADTLIHSTLACGGVLVEPGCPAPARPRCGERLVAVRRLEER